jgi:hypothetical protein
MNLTTNSDIVKSSYGNGKTSKIVESCNEPSPYLQIDRWSPWPLNNGGTKGA